MCHLGGASTLIASTGAVQRIEEMIGDVVLPEEDDVTADEPLAREV